MIQLSEYGETVVDNFNLIGMWIAVLICCRNFSVCYHQYRRTRGIIHLVNLAQVTVFLVHRILYGIIPLFEIQTCAYFPLLVSLWHMTYILFYVVMFMRLIILEHDKYSRWIKIVGILLITLRAADWPYELAFHTIQEKLSHQSGSQCWAEWGAGVIILNFVGDALANLFLSGMFVRRLRSHISLSKNLMSHQNKIIERIAIKSLLCLTLTFVVNLAMNLLKVTNFLGNRSDAFTVYFEIIESTLLVEALRNDRSQGNGPQNSFCESCHKEFSHGTTKAPNSEDQLHSQMLVKSGINNPKYNTDFNESNFDENAMHSVASLEPALFFDRTKSPAKYANEHKLDTFLQNRTAALTHETSLSPPPIVSRIPLGESFAMTKNPSERSTTSSTIDNNTDEDNENKPSSPYRKG
ncbi:uncharacterized protein B0P05DRAFT_549359 [Gilbertella persicaria]|uniref:uncharacterized protein n=1 Tax=Gilbertella persicaria TaxID=101096 RepID=UPI0022206039|nr:uncharacterized protein B0P05DRAFT_549359 [Gilbertella persicaria]KAI8072216.1 hypothetical protein B0P05DRAFT_549359 [Gilbertella persicaria]